MNYTLIRLTHLPVEISNMRVHDEKGEVEDPDSNEDPTEEVRIHRTIQDKVEEHTQGDWR